MKTLTALLAAGCLLATPLAWSQAKEEDHSAHHPAATPKAEAEASAEHDHGEAKSNPLQDKMKQIEGLMQQIQSTSDPAAKRELLSQHLVALREQMALIRSQRGEMKMSMKEDAKKDAGGGMMKGGGMMMMHKKVEQRLDMLERVIEQIIEREATEDNAR